MAEAELRRARLSVGAAVALTIACTLVASVRWLVQGDLSVYIAALHGMSLVLLVALLAYRRTGRLDLLHQICSAFAFGLLALLCYGSGGLPVGPIVWFPMIPIVGILIGGRRVAVTMTVLLLLLLAVLLALKLTGHTFPDALPEPARSQVGGISAFIATLVAAALAWAYDLQRTRAIDRIERSLEEAKGAIVALELARDEAQAADRAKSEFLAMMSHEIRTPLNAVLGMSSLLLKSDLNDSQRSQASAVTAASQQLIAIVNDVLDFSKLEAEGVTLEEIPFDLPATVEDCVDLFAGSAVEKGLVLASFVDPQVPLMMRGDPARLRQVLLNLLSNAIKFTHEGYITIRVELMADALGAPIVRIMVEDTGVGVPEDRRPALFERFKQGDTSTTRRYGGTGLGLSISRQLIELMGGRIWVEARDVGTRFCVDLPLIRSKVPSGFEGLPWGRLIGTAVLVCERHTIRRDAARHILASAGLRPMTVASAAELDRVVAEAKAAGTPPDVAIVDHRFAEGDTDELTRDLLQRGCKAVVWTSESGVVGARDRALAAGASECLTQPMRRYPLLQTVAVSAGLWKPPRRRATAEIPEPSREGLLLLVEDNAVNATVARMALERLGYEVVRAENGRQAVEMLHQAAWSAILMDCHMPEMDGFEATRAIRVAEGDDGRRVPIIAMTAAVLQHDRERCYQAGMDDFIAKPMDLEDLKRMLDRWIS